MGAKMKHWTQKKWIISVSLITLLFVIAIFEEITFSPDASASIQISGSAAFSPPPDINEISDRVRVVKNLSYSDSTNSFLDIYHPRETVNSMPVILWIHGGGYVGGSKDSRQDYAMALADAGYVVANINYALAPASLYPGPVLQANQALAYMQLHAAEYGGDMNRVFVGGDSAGAQIASQVAALVSNVELAKTMAIQPAISNSQLQGALLLCGLYNLDTVRATAFPNIDVYLTAYTGAEPFESLPEIDELSTVQHVTSDFPPVFVTVGDADPFVSQSTELVAVLQSYDVRVSSVFFEGTQKNLKHEYQYDLSTEDARETLKKTLQFLFVHSK
ncbi:lipase [Planococcus antarcticus DSM 14505]|uniref:Lipase n=1 Tax=Planococcus antarcticus DSM 14505 TaxID=1185653 RepID=A0A1C7DCR9_9BACL|nr:alpha/beta hydrolase [Planococcus antarcticus]ANU09063.1 lipase [Planococcus antarcticus DSM 14505]EIM05566.1 lipase [Planococcus antarcticus DSM 14505]